MQRDIYDRSTYDAAQHLAAGSEYFQADCAHHEALKDVAQYPDDDEARRECNEAWSRRFKAWEIMRGWEVTLRCVNMDEYEYAVMRSSDGLAAHEAQQEEAHLSHYEGGHDDDGCTIR